MATATKTLLTAEEFLEMDLGDGSHELVRGEVVEVTPPNKPHAKVCGRITIRLGNFGERTGFGYVLGETAVVTERMPDSVRGADVCFFSNARLPESEDDAANLVAPDLVVEVYSPSNRPGEMQEKVGEYLNAGALMVWVAYPRTRSVVIHRPGDELPVILAEADVIENLPELPGFRCPVAEVFPPRA